MTVSLPVSMPPKAVDAWAMDVMTLTEKNPWDERENIYRNIYLLTIVSVKWFVYCLTEKDT